MATFKHEQGDKQGIFLASTENGTVGEMSYHMESPAIMAIEHTEVKESERGNNIGLDLLNAAVAYAREKSIKIRPLCKFVNVTFLKNRDKYSDVNIN